MSCAIVVLGSPNDINGKLFPIAVSRCKKALSEYHRIKPCKILCTGGFGQHFNLSNTAHGKYLQNYLEKNAVPSSSFLDIALSSFTLEDATLSKPILLKNSITEVVLVTSDFHMERAKLVFNHILPELSFQYAKADTLVCPAEFQRLVTHEENAIQRELLNFQTLNVDK